MRTLFGHPRDPSRFRLAKAESPFRDRGTDGSNPSPSTGESANPRSLSRRMVNLAVPGWTLVMAAPRQRSGDAGAIQSTIASRPRRRYRAHASRPLGCSDVLRRSRHSPDGLPAGLKHSMTVIGTGGGGRLSRGTPPAPTQH